MEAPSHREWRLLLRDSWGPAGLYSSSRRLLLRLGDGGYILHGSRGGRLAAQSLGRDAAGGVACRGSGCSDSAAAAAILHAASRMHGVLCVTLQDYNPYTARLTPLLERLGWRRVGSLYPRILDLTPYHRDPGGYLGDLPKKARNRWRSFLRRGGVVEEAGNPLRLAADMYRVLNSAEWRQGRPIPSKWRRPGWAARLAAWMAEGVRGGWMKVYAAFMDGVLAGFTCIVYTRLHGLVAWFLIDPRYARHGAGNALLTEAVMRLAEEGQPLILQYGYHRPVNPGLNKFLSRQLFRPLRETILCSPGPLAPLARAAAPLLSFAEKTGSRVAALLQHYLRELRG